MGEQFKKMSQQFTKWFEKYDKKQKIKMGVIAVIVIASLIALYLFISKPTMVTLVTDISDKEASQIKDILVENSIKYEFSDDMKVVKVEKDKLNDAKMLLASSSIVGEGFTYDDAFSNSLSTTDSERQLKFQLAKEQSLATDLKRFDGIEDAVVSIVMPDDTRTVLKNEKVAKASAILTTSKDLSADTVMSVVNYLIGSIDQLKQENVRISDNSGRILFVGDEEGSGTVSFNKQYELQQTYSNKLKVNLTAALLSTGLYDDAEIVPNLVLDFDKEFQRREEYENPEGGDKGIVRNIYTYEAEGKNVSASGVPGTDTNGLVTDYQFEDSDSSLSSVSQSQIQYEINKIITEKEKSIGGIVFDKSSVSVVAAEYIIYKQEELEKNGTLDELGVSYEEFKNANMSSVKIDVDETTIDIIKKATGIDNISVVAYQVPMFYDKVAEDSESILRFLPIFLVVVIFIFLAIVVYKGTAPAPVTEEETSLSVEELLSSTREASMPREEIPMDEESETKRMIERFVDEKPEAVAQLLRNWLNEGWE